MDLTTPLRLFLPLMFFIKELIFSTGDPSFFLAGKGLELNNPGRRSSADGGSGRAGPERARCRNKVLKRRGNERVSCGHSYPPPVMLAFPGRLPPGPPCHPSKDGASFGYSWYDGPGLRLILRVLRRPGLIDWSIIPTYDLAGQREGRQTGELRRGERGRAD